jgi:ssDNA-binding Zn-finger/Zn-ribbon topoisomerase 1
MRKTNLKPIYDIIFKLSILFGGECEVCQKKMKKSKSGFTIHHLEYRTGEKTHKDFTNRLKYYQYMTPIIRKYHKKGNLKTKFMFLCNACHHSLDGPRGLNRRKKMNVLRLFLAYFSTNT